MIYSGKIEGGKFHPLDKTLFLQRITELEGKYVEVSISDKKSKRSDRMNRYYWGVVIRYISDETGYEPEELHEYLKEKFLPKRQITLDEQMTVTPSTTELSTDDFQKYIFKITLWAGEFLHLHIPQPNGDTNEY